MTLATTSSLTSNSGQTITITLGTGAGAQTAALVALEFECTGNLVANSGTSNTATTFAATSSVDAQQVAFGAGYVTTAAQQGALAIAVTQVSTVGADGTKPVSIVYTWTPDTSTVLAPTTITLTHTGATPWNANGAVTCTKSGAQRGDADDLGRIRQRCRLELANDRITFTVASAAYGAEPGSNRLHMQHAL